MARLADQEDKANFLENLPAIRRALGIEVYVDRFEGERMIVVGAGPSLDGAYPDLLAAQRRGVKIIAVDRALKHLLERVVLPWMVVTQDASRTVGEFYADPPHPCRLFFHQCASPAFISRWQGQLVTAGLQGGREDLAPFDWGLHVGYAAARAAWTMGAGRIILVGVDLAFTPDATHAGGEVNALEVPSEMVESVNGTEVATSIGFRWAIEEFEARIPSWDCLVVQTSPVGARIRGTFEAPLRQAVLE